MRRARVAVVGLGKPGLRCAQAVLASDDLLLAAIVRRPESAGKRVPDSLGKPAVASLGELTGVDAALVCVPPARTREVASTVLRSGIPIVECARLHGDRFREHKAAIHRVALHAGTSAVVGAGWDPGVLSLFRGLLALVAPHGQTVLVPRSGAALHPTTLEENVAGVERAVATERRRRTAGLNATSTSSSPEVRTPSRWNGRSAAIRSFSTERRTSSRSRAWPSSRARLAA